MLRASSVCPGRDGARRGFAAAALALLGLFLIAGGAWAAEPKFPELTGRIVDDAHLLKPEDRAAIETDLKALEEKSTDQLVVVTLPSLQGYEIEDFGYQLGRHWGIGQKNKNNGVLLIVAPNERKVRIETGRGLEPLVTDLMSKIIIENAIIPEFRRGDYSAGIRAGVRDVKDVLLGDAEAVKERARGSGHSSGGIDWMSVFLICFWLAIFGFIVWAQFNQFNQRQQQANQGLGAQRGRRRRGSGGPPVIFDPTVGSGTWGGRWGSSSGGDSGGGFSGGGGDFGGGGASGSW